MNFFGHCVAACWRSAESAFVLGAMLPDFASMCGSRVAGAGDLELERGLAWHHATDRAFHQSPEFCALSTDLAARLRARGVRRGGALGAGHVGVELLLDGLLLSEPEAAAAYPAAVSAARPERLGSAIRWDRRGAGPRFERLRERLEAISLPAGYRDPDEVARRVERALSRRPRLALDRAGTELEALRGELPGVRARMVDLLPAWMAGLRRALALIRP